MIYWWTGKPGAGKTLHAVDQLLEFKAKGRAVFACNVREFDYERTGVQRMEPADFKNWMEFLPDGAVALVDECYEHGMLPKMPAASGVPAHIKELAKHRHRGIDFIFVCQSPDKQCHVFVHDLIEWHTHVRRMFGTNMVQLRQFDRFEAQAEKATPITTKTGPLLGKKKSVGTYKSTEMDTTEKRVPWYFYALIVGVPIALGMFWYVFGNMGQRLAGDAIPAASQEQGAGAKAADGALATGAAARPALTAEKMIEDARARIASMPWTAPMYDGKFNVSGDPPRIFCAMAAPGETGQNVWRENTRCSCLTEQGTRYRLDMETCTLLVVEGQYEPYFDEQLGGRMVGPEEQHRMLTADVQRRASAYGYGDAGRQAAYGQFRDQPQGQVDPYPVSAW